MLEWTSNALKAAIRTMLSEVKENMPIMISRIVNISKEIENIYRKEKFKNWNLHYLSI